MRLQQGVLAKKLNIKQLFERYCLVQEQTDTVLAMEGVRMGEGTWL